MFTAHLVVVISFLFLFTAELRFIVRKCHSWIGRGKQVFGEPPRLVCGSVLGSGPLSCLAGLLQGLGAVYTAQQVSNYWELTWVCSAIVNFSCRLPSSHCLPHSIGSPGLSISESWRSLRLSREGGGRWECWTCRECVCCVCYLLHACYPSTLFLDSHNQSTTLGIFKINTESFIVRPPLL